MNNHSSLPQNLKNKLLTSTVDLVYLNTESLPTGGASGCLLDFYGKRYLLTVEHVAAVPKNNKLYLSLGWDPISRRTKLREPGTVNIAHQGRLPAEATDLSGVKLQSIDLLFFDLPYEDALVLQDIGPDGTVKSTTPLTVWTEKDLGYPKIGDMCCFAGNTSHSAEHADSSDPDLYLRSTTFRSYSELIYEGKADDFYSFALPFKHPGDEFFEGCSGAPIINQVGKLVALVSHGREVSGDIEDRIYGVPIEKYQLVLNTNRLLAQWNAGGKPFLDD